MNNPNWLCKCKHPKSFHIVYFPGKAEPSGLCWPTSKNVCSTCGIYNCITFHPVSNLEFLEYKYEQTVSL